MEAIPDPLPIGSVVTSKRTGAWAFVKSHNPDGSIVVYVEKGVDAIITLDMVEIFWIPPEDCRVEQPDCFNESA